VKITDQQALKLLEELPLEKVSNEANFLAPLLTKGRTASVVCDDPLYGQRLVAGELGTDNVWWEYEMQDGRVKVIGTVQDQSKPIKVVG
jgi:hypothetical protein